MVDTRPWAIRRRIMYGAGTSLFLLCVFVGSYYAFIREPASCYDGEKNGSERGIDCGGNCARVCEMDTQPLTADWTSAFRITDGLYNAVAYVSNRNQDVGAVDVEYTFTLTGEAGEIIAIKRGKTFIPPDSVYPLFEGRMQVGDKVPTAATLVIDSIGRWEKMAKGREQFEVRSRTLRDTDTAPRLDATLYNTQLEDRFDVEAVATIFDSKRNPLTSSRTVIPVFEARSEKQITFTWPEPIAKTIRSCEIASDVILAIDLSGSINDDGGTPPEPLASVLSAASGFTERLKSDDKAGVVTFATRAQIARTLRADKNDVAAFIEGLAVAPEDERGSTNIGDAIKAATAEFATERHSVNARKVIVLLTDGKTNAPDVATAESYAQEQALDAWNNYIDIFTIGLGANVNREFLSSIATDPEFSLFAPNKEALDAVYRTISTALCEDGAAVIDIIPKAKHTEIPSQD